jgi:NAD(P)-dependent dehydrogenase (short-subunit alcohol dehydrogenase family)
MRKGFLKESTMYRDLFSLEGKTIIITGASSGLGRGLALAYAEAGANIVAASRNLPKLEELVREIEGKGGKALAVQTDVTENADINNMIMKCLDQFGVIDVLFSCAGMSIPGLLAEKVSEQEMQTIMDTNFKGVFLCGTAVGRYMLDSGKGKIINMSSVLGQTLWAKASIYCVSKASIDQITKAWAIEWASRNVTVNALAPTFIITDMNRHLFANKDYEDRVFRHLPMGRIGTIEDLIGPAIFLASSASDFMTGHILTVDGGWTAL